METTRATPSRSAATALLVWVVTRLGLVIPSLLHVLPQQSSVDGDIDIYAEWAAKLVTGQFPVSDPRWQYPPGAALPVLVTRTSPPHPGLAFAAWAMAVDLVVWLLLLRRGRATGTLDGLWLWTIGVAALGPVVWFRFDVLPTALAVGAFALGGFPGGALLAVGAWVKIWPALFLPALAQWRRAFTGWFAVAVVGILAVVIGAQLGNAMLSFATHESTRGLQIESVLATGRLVGDVLGHPSPATYRFGAMELTGGSADTLVTVGTWLQAAVLVAYAAAALSLLARQRAEALLDWALVALLGVTLASRVLSAQYLLWFLGITAWSLTDSRSRQKLTAILLTAAAVLTQIEYPAAYSNLTAGRPGIAAVVVIRNVLLVAALVAAARGAIARTRDFRPQLETAHLEN